MPVSTSTKTDPISTEPDLKTEEQRKAGFLKPLVFGIITLHLIALLVMVRRDMPSPSNFFIISVSMALYLTIFYLRRRRYIQLAGHLFCYSFNALIFLYLLLNLFPVAGFEPPDDPKVAIAFAYLLSLAVLLAGMLISPRAIWIFAVLNSSFIFFPYLIISGTASGALKISFPPISFLYLIALVSWLYQKTLNQAQAKNLCLLQQVQIKARELAEKNETLTRLDKLKDDFLTISEQQPQNIFDDEPTTAQKIGSYSFMISDEMPADTATVAPAEGKFHILVVDDDPINRQVLINQLSLQDYNVTVAANGIEALKLIQPDKQPFDLVILDLMMPKMSGYKACREIRRHYPATELPVIILTAKNQLADLVAGFDSGANDYLLKPFSKVELLVRIRTHLQLTNLRKLNASKDKFFSIVSHDLRAPFTPLLGLSDLLSQMVAEDAGPEEIKRIVHTIHRSAQNVYDLLENLLQWSMMQRGQMPYDPTELQLAEWVENTLALAVENAGLKNIRLCNKVGKELMIYADSYMLTTIIRNLVSNALKFTKSGGEVKVLARQEGDFIKVEVADTGVGIEQENIDKLFKLDVHHTTKGTAREQGTGLGLIMCKGMVEENGGKIWIESKVGQGTTVYFTVPSWAK